MYWRRSAIKEVNDLALSNSIIFLKIEIFFYRNTIDDYTKKSCFEDDSLSLTSSMNMTLDNEDFNDSDENNLEEEDI